MPDTTDLAHLQPYDLTKSEASALTQPKSATLISPNAPEFNSPAGPFTHIFRSVNRRIKVDAALRLFLLSYDKLTRLCSRVSLYIKADLKRII